MAAHHEHKIPLWGLFLALLALTAAEVGLFEWWNHTAQQGDPVFPKLTMVLLLLFVLTLPKAAIVMIYFMHLKFEKQLVVGLALVPFVFAALAIGPTLVDALVLKDSGAYNQVEGLGDYKVDHGGHGEHADPTHADPDALEAGH